MTVAKKLTGPVVSYGVRMLRDEMHALRELAMYEQRPMSDLVRGAALVLLKRAGRYDPDDDDPSAGIIRAAERILARNGQEE